jgi:DNA-binding response OmpR family regulator
VDLPTILVVEDDQLIQGMIEEALSEAGFEVAIATSGEEAVSLLRDPRAEYRALVTDISLRGDLSGWEVGKAAREINPSFPMVYITGHQVQDWASRGVPASIMLPKPFAPAQLVTAVSALINSSSPPLGLT